MATVAAARSIFRSPAARSAALKFASGAKSARSPFRIPTTTSRILRCPVELSAAVETMQPFHSVTASALMTSMLSLSRRSYGWTSEAMLVELALSNSHSDAATFRAHERCRASALGQE
ncbi:nuclear fusion defective 6, mitochondrial-like protein [Drosera capensis]